MASKLIFTNIFINTKGQGHLLTFVLDALDSLFLAHQSQTLTRWACSIAKSGSRRPSPSSIIIVHTLKQIYLQDQLADFSQNLSLKIQNGSS